MKKIFSGLLLILLLAPFYGTAFGHGHTENDEKTELQREEKATKTVPSPSSARRDESGEMMELEKYKPDNKNINRPNPEVNIENFEELKDSIDTRLTKAIHKIDQAIAKINNNTKLSSVTKNELIQILTTVKNKLLSYQTQVSTTTSLQELQTINKAVRDYLKENKDVIRDTLIQAVSVIANEASQNAEQLKGKVEQFLKVLKVTCPSQKDNIATLESLLQSLSSETAELKEYLKDKNLQEVKTVLRELADISKEIVTKATEIQAACLK